MPISMTMTEGFEETHQGELLTAYLNELNLVEKARMLLVVARVARELQGKEIIRVPRFQLVWMFTQGLEMIDYPKDQLSDAAEKLTVKFLEFIR